MDTNGPLVTRQALRTARLFFADELRDGVISDRDLATRADVLRVFAPQRVPRLEKRVAQRLAMKANLLDFERGFLSAVLRARRAMLGDAAARPPKFLIRVDEFPDSKAFDDAPDRWRAVSKAFHETLSDAGVPYLMAIVPQYTHRPLDPSASGGRPLDDNDQALLAQMAAENVMFAQHGTTHRTRYRSPRRRSELCGLGPLETMALIDDGLERLAQVGVFPRVFVPPFNRFDLRQFSQLAQHFDVVGGGPENVPLIGFRGAPTWEGEAVFLPCYAPLYASANTLPTVIDRLSELAIGTWVPIVLHLSWEIGDGFRSLKAFAERVAPYAASWDDFLRSVELSREETLTCE
jgi:hypothetical protein